MAWTGSGSYILNVLYSPEVNGTTIDATRYNGLTTDIATGITNCVAKDGQNTPTANLPMGGYKHTGAAAGAVAGDYLVYGQSSAVLAALGITTPNGTTATLKLTQTGQTAATVNAIAAGVLTVGVDTGAGTTERLRIDSSGNIGIGTTSPALTAANRGNITLNGLTDTIFVLQNAGTTANYIYAANNRVEFDVATGRWLQFNTGGVERLRVDASGNVGIGRTPTSVLDIQATAGGVVRVRGGAGVNQGAAFYATSGSDATRAAFGQYAAIYGGTPGDDAAVYSAGFLSLAANGAEKVRIDTAGNVGIGTTAPAVHLEVSGTGAQAARVTSTNGSTASLLLVSAGVYGWTLNGGSILTLVQDATERMRVDGSGNVGIGGIAPSTLLDVNGTFRARGAVTLDAALTLGNGGTGATTAAGARTNLGLGTAATNNTGDFLSSGTPVPIANGGTAATTAANARTNLGLGTIATAATTDYLSATGGSYTGGTYTGGTFNFTGSLQYGGFEVGFKLVPRNTTAGGVDGQCTAISAGFTLNTGFAGGTIRTFYNDSAAAVTITQGVGLTLRLVGTTSTGNRTLAARGMMTVWANSTTEYIVSGGGLS